MRRLAVVTEVIFGMSASAERARCGISDNGSGRWLADLPLVGYSGVGFDIRARRVGLGRRRYGMDEGANIGF